MISAAVSNGRYLRPGHGVCSWKADQPVIAKPEGAGPCMPMSGSSLEGIPDGHVAISTHILVEGRNFYNSQTHGQLAGETFKTRMV